MLKSDTRAADKDGVVGAKKRGPRPPYVGKRAHSLTPIHRAGELDKKPNRRCASLSPAAFAKQSIENLYPSVNPTSPDNMEVQNITPHDGSSSGKEMQMQIPRCMVIKLQRVLASKKREFMKMRKSLISQQSDFIRSCTGPSKPIHCADAVQEAIEKVLLEMYASVREMEVRAGESNTESLGEVRVVSVTSWPAHDLLLLVRDDLEFPVHSEVNGVFGPQILQQLNAQMSTIPEELLSVGAELMARRIDLLHLLRGKHRSDRPFVNNLEWKTKNTELDHETERLHRLVAGTAENLKAKINYSLELAKIPWIDRDSLMKKLERYQKENMVLQHKLEDAGKTANESAKDGPAPPATLLVEGEGSNNYQAEHEELLKERAAREALKEVVAAAESMLRVARARIATLERQLKDAKAELEAARRKHKDLEQLYRHRETSYDARSKKLLEVSKTGEITIEALSRQRDALELRVKELREQAEQAEKLAKAREVEQRSNTESLQAKVIDQEKRKEAAESRTEELERKVRELEDTIHSLRERSGRLVDMERRRCVEYVPSKENEPSDRETEIWKELQITRVALSRAEEELRQSRADKDNFLNSLSKIAQDGADNLQDKMATELLDKEQRIAKLQQLIDEQRENEKLMEQSMTHYENQLATLRLEVKRLRNYDCYSKEVPFQELQTELLELHMQVEALSRERTALVTAAASRALMLERHERAADLFARVTRARRDLTALLEGRCEPPLVNEVSHTEASRSLSSICLTSAETWTALRAERARVLRLESAVLAQSLQLEREGRVRTQLERRRAMLEREVLRAHTSNVHESARNNIIKNPYIVLCTYFATVFAFFSFYGVLLNSLTYMSKPSSFFEAL